MRSSRRSTLYVVDPCLNPASSPSCGVTSPKTTTHQATHIHTFQPRWDSAANRIQSINHTITYSIITSSPELTYSSVLSTIRLHAVTAGDHSGSTYVEWSAHFSSDATAGQSYPVSCVLWY